MKEKADVWRAGVFAVFLIALLVNIYWGYQKPGFHEDEYYTYYSSNRSIGLYQPDREWQDRQTILDEFSVKPGEGFNYGLVKLVQSWDVHPPFYYYIFHTICSLFGGIFTKWSGLITNLAAFVVVFFLLYVILQKLGVSPVMQLIILLFWAINPQTISCNLLIRMYAWLTVLIFACACIHISMIQKIEGEGDSYDIRSFMIAYMLPLAGVSFLGFLTQYFYLFFFVPTGFAFAVWLFFVRKDTKKSFIYVATCILSLGAAVLYYPASAHHMLGGYRGNEAAESFLNVRNTVKRLSFFVGLMNDYVFGGGLLFLLAVIVIAIIVSMVLKRKSRETATEKNASNLRRDSGIRPDYMVLTFGTICYFLLTSKAALVLGSASNRYEMPIYGLIILLIFVAFEKYLLLSNEKLKYSIISLFALVLLVKGIAFSDHILFLYSEDTEKIQYACDNADEVAIVMFNPATPYNVWRLTNELLEYKKVFYMDEENQVPITDPDICLADKIILYIADDDMQETAIQNLIDSTGISTKRHFFAEDMWNSYEFTMN